MRRQDYAKRWDDDKGHHLWSSKAGVEAQQRVHFPECEGERRRHGKAVDEGTLCHDLRPARHALVRRQYRAAARQGKSETALPRPRLSVTLSWPREPRTLPWLRGAVRLLGLGTTVTRLLHDCYTTVTRLLRDCYATVTQRLHGCSAWVRVPRRSREVAREAHRRGRGGGRAGAGRRGWPTSWRRGPTARAPCKMRAAPPGPAARARRRDSS